jgi:Ran GTPase-activating protein (RanGAP) involved in mRNA processing and transport
MSVLERYGVRGEVAVLRPSDFGVQCKESDVIDIATELARNRTLTSVDLTGATVSTEAARALGAVLGKNTTTIVQHLCLANCDMHADTIAALAPLLAANDRLEVLDLRGNPIRDEGAAAVGELLAVSQTLRTVDLTSCKIGPAGARAIGDAIAANAKLRNLNLANNKLRAAGMAALSDGLKRNTSLRVLDLSGNSINAEGGLTIAELLRANESIESINLARNYLSDAVPKIGHALSTRNRPTRLLDLSANRIDGAICRALAQVLEGNRISVACLSLEGNTFGDVGMVPLYHAVKGTGIQFLDLSSTGLTHHSGVVIADLIASCKQLNSIQLDGNDLGDDAGVEIAVAFGASKAVTAMNLERTSMGPRAAAALCTAISQHDHTRNLNISENPQLRTNEVIQLLRALSNRTALEELDLSNLDLPEGEELLRALVDVFPPNKKLAAILLEHTGMGGAVPQSILTRELALSLLRTGSPSVSVQSTLSGTSAAADKSFDASGLIALHGMTKGGARATATAAGDVTGTRQSAHGVTNAVGLSRLEMTRNAETIFKPAWALTVPLDPPVHEADRAEDGSHPPLVPHPASLHHPLYPGYGYGRFSNGSLVQTLSMSVPYNVAVSHGTRQKFIPTADGATSMTAPPRRAMKESPYSLHALENNPGQLPVTEDQLRRKFSELDVEGNGYLVREDFKRLYMSFQSFGLPLTAHEANTLFSQYAPAKDKDKVKYEEFSVLMLKLASR